MGKKVLITGATGMVGKGVLLECLDDNEIDQVILVNRRPIGLTSPKIKELLLDDFTQIDRFKEDLKGLDACFYCMGISAVGLSEEVYTKITFNPTKEFADTLYDLNPGMTFIYVSGTGTDSSENGRVMWARVKGKTENLILNKGFKKAYAFRPGFIIPEKGIESRTALYNNMYKLLRPFFPWLKKMSSVTTTSKIGRAMINTIHKEQLERILENKAINVLAAS
ncbi:MAG: NAD-dependent epimerase/dehydratase family protein [Saprospiraceae bacterium]|nr:NAD-dependent epimerase/dehydratase family protein [Saprospiraceae bacterium]